MNPKINLVDLSRSCRLNKFLFHTHTHSTTSNTTNPINSTTRLCT